MGPPLTRRLIHQIIGVPSRLLNPRFLLAGKPIRSSARAISNKQPLHGGPPFFTTNRSLRVGAEKRKPVHQTLPINGTELVIFSNQYTCRGEKVICIFYSPQPLIQL